MITLPFPTNWGEELISEYLELEGYFVRTNLPVPTEEKGGRGELDILGLKVEEEQLKILHVETGIPSRLGEMKRNRSMIEGLCTDLPAWRGQLVNKCFWNKKLGGYDQPHQPFMECHCWSRGV